MTPGVRESGAGEGVRPLSVSPRVRESGVGRGAPSLSVSSGVREPGVRESRAGGGSGLRVQACVPGRAGC